MYDFMTRNHVPFDHPDIQYPPPQLANIYASLDLEHSIGFASAYASVFGAEPEYTNYTGICNVATLVRSDAKKF